MKRWMRTLASVVMAGSMLATMLPLGAMAETADTTVTLGEASVLKHGRTYEKDGTLYLDWTNSGITFNFEGTGAKAKLTSSSLSPNPGYVNVYVDGALTATTTLLLDKTSAEYTLAENLSAGSHTITLRKRNEAVYGGSATVGIASLTITGGSLKAAPAAAERQIEVIGDSITCGFGNLAADSSVSYNSHVSDGTSTYATMAAQALGADVSIVARSGIRFVRVDEGNSIYPVYEKVSGLGNKCNDAYDFASNPKDVVVINLGTNDNGAREDTNGDGKFDSSDKLVTDEYIQSEAKAFLELVRKNNPDAEIVWAYGIMGSGRVNAIKAAIKEVNDAGDNKVSFFALDQIKPLSEGYGSGNHPTVATSINRSMDLAEYIAQRTGWDDYHYDVQLAQQKRLNAAFDEDSLKQYTQESVKVLTDAIDAVNNLDSSASAADIKAAVAAVYAAKIGLVVDMEDVAVIGAEEKSGTGHYMNVVYTPSPSIDVSAYVGRKLYITYDIMVETTNKPTSKDWLSFVHNGQAGVWTDGTTDDKTRINVGSAIGFGSEPLNKADTQWVTMTSEVPDALADGGKLTAFKLYVYNDTVGMNGTDGKDSEGIAWSNDNGVTIKVKNVKLMAVTSDYVNKEALKTALETQKTEAQLSSYTEESVADYVKCFTDAKAVYDNPDATQQEVNAAVSSLKNAEKLLVLKDENTIVMFWNEEVTTPEDHYLSKDVALPQPLDLNPYANDELVLSYDIRINVTDNHPDPSAAGWMDYIRNGEARLFSVDASAANNDNRVTVGGDESGKIHANKNELAGMQPNEWKTVTLPVPQAILEAGRITKFHLFIYNDMNAYNAAWKDNVGVTLSLRNVKIAKKAGTPVVDKTALDAAIEEYDKIDLTQYTTGVEEFKAALAAAKAVSADSAATQTQVDDALSDLNVAKDALGTDAQPADKSELDQLITVADAIDTNYYASGVEEFDAALAAAKAVSADSAATQTQVDDAIEVLTTAMADIVPFWGNVDGQDKVSAADALMALQAATKKITLNEMETLVANVSGDDQVTAEDALLILQHATKKIQSFPVEKTV